MSREEYLCRLEELLADIPQKEREDALCYYNDYFDAGGVENEEENMASLGTPEELAKTIRLASDDTTVIDGEFTETGYSDGINDNYDMPDKYTQIAEYDGGVNSEKTYRVFGKKFSKSTIIVLIIILILLGPVIFGILGGVIGAVFSILGGLIGVIAGLFGSGISILIGSVFGIGIAAISFITKPMGALTILGFSLLGLAVGGLMIAACTWLIGLIPPLFRWTIKIVKTLIGWIKGLILGKEEE